ncbi:MAG TPA: hypothetical protein IAB63_11305 [Candidatus Onthocola gallistercoris]|uniref:Solute-binding protein family 5 domain-containing protein n=1 Tax=Candidatus Onthocola gallistercoris TaxID=2840876 RepID=A0A9D1HJQ3_9FIRM|nr:hypothetical protein [Candidatus Onthocola gallistercoris]
MSYHTDHRLNLRDDVYFNDENHTPLTADDIKFTLDRATEQIIATFINGYAGSEVVDDHTIIIETESYNNEFRPYIEPSSRVIALQAGEVDVCINPPINELQYLESDDNIVVHEEPGTRLFYFAFNVTKEPWNNQTLRQAVACAIDRESVLQAAVEGKGTLQSANHSRQINKGHGLSCYSFFMISHGLIYISFRSTR